jgi:hypothetical protein
VYFKETQPKGIESLRSVPVELRGNYIAGTEEGANDTLSIVTDGFIFRPEDQERSIEYHKLSDSLVLKQYKGYYFLSIYEKPYWTLRVIQQDRDGLTISYMDKEGVSFHSYLMQLSTRVKVDSVQLGGDTRHFIEPRPKELVHLIKEGYFMGSTLRRIK